MTNLRVLVPALAIALGLAAPGHAATWKIAFFSDANPTVQVGEGTFDPDVTTLDPDVLVVGSWSITVNSISYPTAVTTKPTFSTAGGTPVLGFALQDQTGQFILSSRVPDGTTQRWETQNCADDCATTASGTFTLTQLSDAPAVIPLPATAVLLPIGLGALALMRRRRAKG